MIALPSPLLQARRYLAGQSLSDAPMVAAADLSWAVVKMHAVEPIVVNAALIAAY